MITRDETPVCSPPHLVILLPPTGSSRTLPCMPHCSSFTLPHCFHICDVPQLLGICAAGESARHALLTGVEARIEALTSHPAVISGKKRLVKSEALQVPLYCTVLYCWTRWGCTCPSLGLLPAVLSFKHCVAPVLHVACSTTCLPSLLCLNGRGWCTGAGQPSLCCIVYSCSNTISSALDLLTLFSVSCVAGRTACQVVKYGVSDFYTEHYDNKAGGEVTRSATIIICESHFDPH